MNNLFLIESTNEAIIKTLIDDILKKNKFNKDELITYDMEEVNVSDAIVDLDTYGMFTNRKIVHIKNALFLTTETGEIEHNLEVFKKYLDNPNPDNILIISCSKMDGKKNICKLVKEKCTVLDTELNLKDYIKKNIEDYHMDNDTMNYLCEVTGNIERLLNELNKLKMYKMDKLITRDDIDKIVIKKIDDNIFHLIDAIIRKDKKKALTIYNEMINYGEEVFKILIALSNQIRLIYQVKVLKNMSDSEIMDILKIKNSKQVYVIRQKISSYKEEDLINYLTKLSIMDEELKLGKSIDTIVFPVFIASL